MVPAMGEGAAATALAGVPGFPAALTNFVGRAGEVAEVAGLLAECRLVTVTGPGGMGKTRLAGEVAGRVAGRFADGVRLVELASVQDPALVQAAVSVALGVGQAPGAPLADSLAAALGRQQLLLVLDNCEHLIEAVAEAASAREADAAALQAECLSAVADLELRTGRVAEATASLREALGLAAQAGTLALIDCLDVSGHLCAQTQRWAEALTVWAAMAACECQIGLPDLPQEIAHRAEPLSKARRALGPAGAQAAEDRGAAMTLAIAVEFATLQAAGDPRHPSPAAGQPQLSARERELVTLVAQGRTDAQIAAQLYISVRTVRSHLDRIRDKTGYRRRADLTRLALNAGLV
jgi:DNA-binding NarL/FixJ family response regulator